MSADGAPQLQEVVQIDPAHAPAPTNAAAAALAQFPGLVAADVEQAARKAREQLVIQRRHEPD